MTQSNTNNILLTHIQRFSIHDGPGIRTTVFLKGCSIHCPWCSNPENLLHKEQWYVKRDHNGKVEEEGTYGKWYSPDELYKEVIKDRAFYGACGSDGECGGVTFSGGECMLQMKELEPLLIRLNNESIHTAVETSLYCNPSQLSIALSHIDLFFVDIKILDDGLCSSVLSGRFSTYKENLETLLNSSKPVVFRIPVIGGYTDQPQNRKAVVELIKEKTRKYKNIPKIEILKEHNLGLNKYQSLIEGGNEIELPEYSGIEDSLMEQYKKEIEEVVGSQLAVEICRI